MGRETRGRGSRARTVRSLADEVHRELRHVGVLILRPRRHRRRLAGGTRRRRGVEVGLAPTCGRWRALRAWGLWRHHGTRRMKISLKKIPKSGGLCFYKSRAATEPMVRRLTTSRDLGRSDQTVCSYDFQGGSSSYGRASALHAEGAGIDTLLLQNFFGTTRGKRRSATHQSLWFSRFPFPAP